MSKRREASEPSIEEILAAVRRIIASEEPPPIMHDATRAALVKAFRATGQRAAAGPGAEAAEGLPVMAQSPLAKPPLRDPALARLLLEAAHASYTETPEGVVAKSVAEELERLSPEQLAALANRGAELGELMLAEGAKNWVRKK